MIYFVTPTRENLNLIIKDLNDLLYDSVYICFNRAVFEKDISDFYKKVIEIERVSLLKGVWEINLNNIPIGN